MTGEPDSPGGGEYQPSQDEPASGPVAPQTLTAALLASPQPSTMVQPLQEPSVSTGPPATRDESGRWLPGVSGRGDMPRRGPIISPHLQRYANMTRAELQKLRKSGKLNMGQQIAISMLLDAANNEKGGYKDRDRTRQLLLDRLEGPVSDDKAPAQAVQVNIIQHGGSLGV